MDFRTNTDTARFVDDVVSQLDISEPESARIREDLSVHIMEMLGDNPTFADITDHLGESSQVAEEFRENLKVGRKQVIDSTIDSIVNRRLSETLNRYMGYERKSKTTVFGIPLVHVVVGTQYGKQKTAKGIIACGPKAVGVVALGGASMGVVSFGGFSLGVLSYGGFSLGLLFAIGGFAASLWSAIGGFAAAFGNAFGGFAAAHNVFGGLTFGNVADPTLFSFGPILGFLIATPIIMVLLLTGLNIWARAKKEPITD